MANAVGQQFSVLVNDLETPQGQTVSPVKVSVVEPATLPGAPVSPNKKLDLALGLLIGLALGSGARSFGRRSTRPSGAVKKPPSSLTRPCLRHSGRMRK